MDSYKKGGQAGNSNLLATNRLFKKNPLFKKKKKKASGIYNPKAAFKYEEGGALLTKKVTCKNCGWKWDAADGGDDVTTCHKCGGLGLVHAKKGGEQGCPQGYHWDETKKSCVSNFFTAPPTSKNIDPLNATKSKAAIKTLTKHQVTKKTNTPKEQLNLLKKRKDQLDAQNGGLGPSSLSGMLEARSLAQKMGELESNNKESLNNTPILNKANSIGTIALTAGKYFAPKPLQQAIDVFLNGQDTQEYINNPNDELNQAGVASDALSFIKSKKTKLSPFSYVGDMITLKQKLDQFNNATKQSYKNGGDISIPTLNTMAKGGKSGCPPDHYYNGKSCVKIPAETKKAKVINDPDEYAFRKAAYDDSLHLYNTYKNLEPKKVGKLRSTKNTWHDPYKTYTATKIFTPAEQKEWASNHGGRSQAFSDYASKLYDAEMEKGNFDFDWPSVKNDPIGYKANVGIYKLLNRNTGKDTKNSEIAFRFKKPVQPVVLGQKSNPKPKSTNLKPKTTNAKTVAKVENQYPTGYDQPIVTPVPPGKTQVGTQEIQNLDPKTGRVKTIIEPVYEDNPMPEKLPLLPPQLIDTPRAELQGEYIENNAPEYQMPGYDVERAGIYMRHGNRPTLTTVRRPGMVSKALQKFTGYNPEYSEGYTDEEGNYVSGEFENAQAENRKVNFQGASSLQDLKAQKEYNKAYDEYEAKQQEYEAKQQFAKAMAAGYGLKKDGGSTKDYIEVDIPEEQIQNYIDQGYIIEPVSKLKKFIN